MATARNAALGKIHIAVKQLDMADDNYRALLRRVAGVSSAKELDQAGLDKVLKELVRLGFQPKPSQQHGRKPTVTANRQAQLAKIEALLTDRKLPWSYLTRASTGKRSMLQRLCGVDAIEWASGQGLNKLIAALAIDQQRRSQRADGGQDER